MSTFQPLKYIILHGLENFLDMYKQGPAEVVLVESIANAIDSGATSVHLNIDKEREVYSILDNASGMSAKTFEQYHTVALSTKTKGTGIGFAGVGAKIYLAAWSGAEIFTETYGDDGPLASKMYRVGDEVGFEMISPSLKDRGTKYSVKLSHNDFKDLKENISHYVSFWYNSALEQGFKITLGGVPLLPWTQELEASEKGTLRIDKKRFPYLFWISKEDAPEYRIGMEYVVFGKRVKVELPAEFYYDIDPDFHSRIGAIVSADDISNFLTSDKTDFKKNQLRNNVISKVRSLFYQWLEEQGAISVAVAKSGEYQEVDIDLTKELGKLITTKDLKWLNPWSPRTKGMTLIGSEEGSINASLSNGGQSVRGDAPGNGDGNGVITAGPEPGNGPVEDSEGESKAKEVKRTKSGLRVISDYFEKDPREGWLSVENKAVVYNLAHPLHSKIEKEKRSLSRYDLARVIVSVLIQGAAENREEELTAQAALDLQSDLLTKLFTSAGSNLKL